MCVFKLLTISQCIFWNDKVIRVNRVRKAITKLIYVLSGNVQRAINLSYTIYIWVEGMAATRELVVGTMEVEVGDLLIHRALVRLHLLQLHRQRLHGLD